MTVPLPIWVHVGKNGIHRQFGLVSWSSLETEEQGYILKPISSMSFPEDRTLINVPRIIANTDILHGLRGITCVDNEQFWTCGIDNIMRLYNLQGELVQTIQTNSGILPRDIAVIKNGDLVYIDSPNFTVNVVKNTQIFKVFRKRKWRPLYVCCSSSGDFLVVMENVKTIESKVVRYSGSLETQSIQFDAKGQLLYSKCSEFQCSKYIVENKNLDICVADTHENAIIVVNCAGELRFRYIDINKPTGITADSQGRILASERYNNRIHILDQEGQFLRYIDNCCLVTPWNLSIDNDDKLLVMMKDGDNVKKIQYCL